MGTSWLANAYHESFWPHHTWGEFAALSAEMKAEMIVVLPIHGFVDHGLGLPLDAEEVVGSEVLRIAAAQACVSKLAVSVLPPLRFGLAPYPSCVFGLDAETAYEQMSEIVRSVKASGFSKIVFFNTSPWNEELVATVALDMRVAYGLKNYVINLSKLGLSFHPGAINEARANAQAAAMHMLGLSVENVRDNLSKTTKTDVRDAGFRPGNYQHPTTLSPDELLDSEAVVDAVGTYLARLLGEVGNGESRVALTLLSAPNIVQQSGTDKSVCATLFPQKYRAHYLPAFTRAELAVMPEKERALVIIPTGAIEQHGHHLPVGVDAILGQAFLANTLPRLSADVARRVFVMPPITYGKSNEHEGFPGTVTISAKTLRRVLLAMANELHALGFRNIAILNTHGGNSPVIVYTLREIQTTLGLRAGMVASSFKPGINEMTPQESKYGFHAGQWETSLMLACAPELVHTDKAICEYPTELEKTDASLAWMTRDLSKSGVMGDARVATADQGKKWLDKVTIALVTQVSDLLGK